MGMKTVLCKNSWFSSKFVTQSVSIDLMNDELKIHGSGICLPVLLFEKLEYRFKIACNFSFQLIFEIVAPVFKKKFLFFSFCLFHMEALTVTFEYCLALDNFGIFWLKLYLSYTMQILLELVAARNNSFISNFIFDFK